MKLLAIFITLTAFLFAGCRTKEEINTPIENQKLIIFNNYLKSLRSVKDYVNNSVAIYSYNYRPLNTGKITDIRLTELYNETDKDFSKKINELMEDYTGVIRNPYNETNYVTYCQLICFLNVKNFDDQTQNIPIIFNLIDNHFDLNFRGINCSTKEFKELLTNKINTNNKENYK